MAHQFVSLLRSETHVLETVSVGWLTQVLREASFLSGNKMNLEGFDVELRV